MIILKDQDIDMILGMNWMYQHKAVIDVLNRTLRVSLPDSNSQLLKHPQFSVKGKSTE